MSELERAIEHDQQHGKWYAYGRAVLGGTDFIHPVEIAGNGNVVCRTGSSQKPVSPEEYLRVHREFAPFRKVGIWDFVPWDDEAASEIRAAHQSPGSAGRKIVRLRKRLARAEELLRGVEDCIDHMDDRDFGGDVIDDSMKWVEEYRKQVSAFLSGESDE